MKSTHRRLILMSSVYVMGLTALGLCGYAAYKHRDAITDYAAPKLAALEMPAMPSLPDMPQWQMPVIKTPDLPDLPDMPHIDWRAIRMALTDGLSNGLGALGDVADGFKNAVAHFSSAADARVTTWMSVMQKPAPVPPPLPSYTLTEMISKKEVEVLAVMEPASGNAKDTPEKSAWDPDQPELTVESVLVPRQVTVISSSRDGRIADMPVQNGDEFAKGDILVAYDCADIEAEAAIAGMEKKLTKKKIEGSDKLFKLDIISDVDRLGVQVEDKRADAKMRLYEARLDDCRIRAEFDGRVTNRLANPGEYTRTDRVLLEVASTDALQAEFLIPSRWLRWVDVGAPLTIRIGETDRAYGAKVSRIHGEVDPVSQSIQVVATLESYGDRLLPGMSGQAVLDVNDIRKAGIKGFLQKTALADEHNAAPE